MFKKYNKEFQRTNGRHRSLDCMLLSVKNTVLLKHIGMCPNYCSSKSYIVDFTWRLMHVFFSFLFFFSYLIESFRCAITKAHLDMP